jgi:uncharacterized membrane protein
MNTPALPPTLPPLPDSGAPPADGWAVTTGRGVVWWSDAWRLFTAAPGIWIAITLLYGAILIGLSIIPLLGQVASTLLQPVLFAGLVLGCRAVDRGGKLSVSHLFAGFDHKPGPLFVLGALYFAGWLVVACVAVFLMIMVIGAGTLGALLSGDAMQAATALLSVMSLGAIVVLLVAALFVVPLLMAIWFAPALIVLRGDEPFAAMRTSFRASMRNIPPFLVYGLVGLVFSLLACIPLFLGLLVFMPVASATIYTSYKDIFGDPA